MADTHTNMIFSNEELEAVRDRDGILHAMTDLETLSLEHSPAFISVGCILFNPYIINTIDEIQKLPYVFENINVVDAVGTGHISSSTIKWWRKQGDEAHNSLVIPFPVRIKEAIDKFVALNRQTDKFWSHGKEFDMVILIDYLESTNDRRLRNLESRNTMDTRTTYSIAYPNEQYPPLDKDVLRRLTKHSAYDDCVKQIMSVQVSLNKLCNNQPKP